MSIKWIPVKEGLPDMSDDATRIDYLITCEYANGSRKTIMTNWGPVGRSYAAVSKEKDGKDYCPYIFDGWAFGEMDDDKITVVDNAVAWAYVPQPYME